MSFYPSLEDLKVDKVIQAQTAFSSNPANPAILSEASAPIPQDGSLYPRLYPELSEYMGLSLNEEEVHKNLPMVAGTQSQGQLVTRPSTVNYMVAPVTGNDVGIRRAEIKQGIREIIVCKDQDGKIGLHLKSIDNGIFVQLVFFSTFRGSLVWGVRRWMQGWSGSVTGLEHNRTRVRARLKQAGTRLR
uniref:Syntenin-1 n=1 Tax=Terrapene triunguis TaxID=2587831 RepID=A0A674JHH3_9SAUR